MRLYVCIVEFIETFNSYDYLHNCVFNLFITYNYCIKGLINLLSDIIVMDKEMILSEILIFMRCKFGTIPKQNLLNVISGFYDVEAKKICMILRRSI